MPGDARVAMPLLLFTQNKKKLSLNVPDDAAPLLSISLKHSYFCRLSPDPETITITGANPTISEFIKGVMM
jgi:hypothetical protein